MHSTVPASISTLVIGASTALAVIPTCYVLQTQDVMCANELGPVVTCGTGTCQNSVGGDTHIQRPVDAESGETGMTRADPTTNVAHCHVVIRDCIGGECLATGSTQNQTGENRKVLAGSSCTGGGGGGGSGGGDDGDCSGPTIIPNPFCDQPGGGQ